MRRHAYPYGRYLIRNEEIKDMGIRFHDFIKKLKYPIIKYDKKNEGHGILIIAVNKKIMGLMKQKKPPGRIQMLLSRCPVDMHSFRDMILSRSQGKMQSFREMDLDSQRVGIEIYLWPMEDEILLEIFILPYMERLNRPEIYGITQTKEEEITDWYLCEQIWDEIIPRIEGKFDLESIKKRA